MADYYVNNIAQTNGDHEVHKEGCQWMPSNKKYLGNFSNCTEAVRAAKKTYSKSNGCNTCSRECHTT
ncbi:MAG: hypothetical protein ACOYXT_02900 [Bacteroidota bacterium]